MDRDMLDAMVYGKWEIKRRKEMELGRKLNNCATFACQNNIGGKCRLGWPVSEECNMRTVDPHTNRGDEVSVNIGNLTMQHKLMLNSIYGVPRTIAIINVIFNDPATIVFWSDDTKTVVKCDEEAFDPEKGLAMAIAKKAMGNQGNYYNEFKKWLPEEEKE